jgi:putative hydrolase of the HAD superfamily
MTDEKITAWWERCQHWTATHLIVEAQDGSPTGTPAGAPVGETGWGFRNVPGMLEIKLARAYWGKGYASDTLAGLLGYILNETTIERVIVNPHRENIPARRLYRRFGFQPDLPPTDSGGDWDDWTLSRSHRPPLPSTLIFDWGGVLMRTEDDHGRREWEARLGLPAGGADRAVFESDAWQRAQLGQCAVQGCWNAIGDSLGLAPAALAQFRRDFWAGDRLNRVLVQRIREWKAAGYRVALLSNYSPELETLLDEHRLHQLFHPVIISAFEGVMKPASRLFWRALNRIGISPAEALLVDDFVENVAGARNVGLHAVRFQGSQQAVSEIEELLQ